MEAFDRERNGDLGQPRRDGDQRLHIAQRHAHLQRDAHQFYRPGPRGDGQSGAQTGGASGYTIKPDNSTINNAAQAESTGFTFTGAEVGDTYNYTVTGGSSKVTGSGTVTSANQDVTGINISTLPNGTLTFSVTLTNPIGPGPAATATATLAVPASPRLRPVLRLARIGLVTQSRQIQARR